MPLGKVGIVFTGGGFTGAVSVGFAKAIWKNGIVPSIIQGVSVGALNAAKIIESDVDELIRVWLEIEKMGPYSIFNWKDIAMNVLRRNPSLYNNSGLWKLIDTFDISKITNAVEELQIITRNESDDLKINIFRNHDNLFKKDPQLFKKVILAATALQGGFPPVQINGEMHSDGMRYWIRPLVEKGCDTIFLLLNDQANEGQMRWDQRLAMGHHTSQDENAFLRLENLLSIYKDYYVILEEKMAEEKLPLLVKRLRMASVGKLARRIRSVISSAAQGDDINLTPHRIFVLNTRRPITTLYTTGFQKGDIKAAIEQGYDQASNLLEKIL